MLTSDSSLARSPGHCPVAAHLQKFATQSAPRVFWVHIQKIHERVVPNIFDASEAGDVAVHVSHKARRAGVAAGELIFNDCRPLRGLRIVLTGVILGVSLRSTQDGVPGRASRLGCETLY
jgi:hypothetical protein